MFFWRSNSGVNPAGLRPEPLSPWMERVAAS